MKVAAKILLIISGILALISAWETLSFIPIAICYILCGVFSLIAAQQKSRGILYFSLILSILFAGWLGIIGIVLALAAFDEIETEYRFFYKDKNGKQRERIVLIGGNGYQVSGMRKASKLCLLFGAAIALILTSTFISSFIFFSFLTGASGLVTGFCFLMTQESFVQAFNDLVYPVYGVAYSVFPKEAMIEPGIAMVVFGIIAGSFLIAGIMVIVSAIVSLAGASNKPKFGLHIANIVFSLIVFGCSMMVGLFGFALAFAGFLILLGAVLGMVRDIQDKKLFIATAPKESASVVVR